MIYWILEYIAISKLWKWVNWGSSQKLTIEFSVILSSDSCRNIHIYAGYIPTQWTGRKTSLEKYIPLTLFVRVQKGYSRVACERELETEQKLQYFDLHLWPSTLCLSRSPGLLNWRPWAHSAGWWLLLLHLISNFSGPQTPSGFPRAPRPGVAFPTTSRL